MQQPVQQTPNPLQPQFATPNMLDQMKKSGMKFKKATLSYASVPTHQIEVYSDYYDGFLIMAEDLETHELDVFEVRQEPEREMVTVIKL
jgi:hypothetical protein